MMNLTYDENSLIAIYNAGNRQDTISELQKIRTYLTSEEQDLLTLTDAAIAKLRSATDADFSSTDFYADFELT